ncbi:MULTISPECIES: hypothetical protein [unclassified Fusobacterium]|uniref:hypothetical protein n=1 Tax=unclassified Fusobacterium TaxID=2648384 RepID=UPI001B8B017B|nr:MULTISPECIES: hypothetical protein [unclassified Fusobacterium]MBR8701417.1 hypothetical protein [Fusobacterium sp. DD45]MBR8711197.1 hypothetical protein [Fusobacterium sp. DD28]MBR8751724.1 hypothetical protein [Fusobacterium sp. DD26]
MWIVIGILFFIIMIITEMSESMPVVLSIIKWLIIAIIIALFLRLLWAIICSF